ncbi:hypothetical protein SUNI508_08085 [Seiridium unicorne]|uniref:Uncharacterized protein n=1 Tax=Seiridium unicorne TaxID=138068 RepID=A0ABR2UUL7_9PEZI
MSDTVLELASQWTNPTDVTTVLMIIGGDVVQKALAQTTGCWYTPVCFSFGWVAYAFMALVNILGEGRLLPPPDYPVKVFNLETGYVRENRNWVIGRLLRDQSAYMSRKEAAPHAGIRIAVWEALNIPNQRHTGFSYSKVHVWGVFTTIVQLVVAAIPLILNGRWGILLITCAGTLLAIMAGGLPQWRAEKLPNRQSCKKVFALTTGNGARDIMIINGAGNCLDLEELCAQETPRGEKPWEKFMHDALGDRAKDKWEKPGLFSKPVVGSSGSFHFHRTGTQIMEARTTRGLPRGFFVTMITCVVQSILWLLLLISVAALIEDTWFLILVGGIGMFQNGYLAAMERSPKHRNIPLKLKEVITRPKVMDGLMDLEVGHGRRGAPLVGPSNPLVFPLVAEFFNGQLRPNEKAWWDGDRGPYDHQRSAEKGIRGAPRTEMPSLESRRPSQSAEGTALEHKPGKTNDFKRMVGKRSDDREVVSGSYGQGLPTVDRSDFGDLEQGHLFDHNDVRQPRSPPHVHYRTGAMESLHKHTLEKVAMESPPLGSATNNTPQGRSRSHEIQNSSQRFDTLILDYEPKNIGSFPEWLG